MAKAREAIVSGDCLHTFGKPLIRAAYVRQHTHHGQRWGPVGVESRWVLKERPVDDVPIISRLPGLFSSFHWLNHMGHRLTGSVKRYEKDRGHDRLHMPVGGHICLL